MHPQELVSLRQLAAVGAHPEVLAQVFGRDPRTIRAVLHQAGLRSLSSAPVPRDWRTGLPPATIAAIRAYVAQLRAQEQAAWQRLRQAAVDVTAATYTFPAPAAYTAILQTVQPPEALVLLSRRLGVDINRILLAYVEGEPPASG
jgi:hypothetical protein